MRSDQVTGDRLKIERVQDIGCTLRAHIIFLSARRCVECSSIAPLNAAPSI